MRSFFILLLVFLSISSFSQIPSALMGIDPSSISKEDLEKYGVTESDIQNLIQQYEDKPSISNVSAGDKKVEEVLEVVVKDEEVKPTEVNNENSGRDNYVYGRELLINKNLKIYENATHIKASSNYILGSGDEISISIWGYSEHSGTYTVNENGAISPKLVGKIPLKGMKFSDAKALITSRFGNVYDLKNSSISIELTYSKVIRVNIVGEVMNPGTYSVPSINSAFNILALAGGITKNGSVRNINIKRDGKVVQKIDVYQFLMDPDFKNDFFLSDNDFIVVENIGKVVELKGEVTRTDKYELTENEGLKDLMVYSGGLKSSAYKAIINVNRYQNNQDILIEVPFDSLMQAGSDFKLHDGDRIYVKTIPSEVRNRVTINGSANITGSFLFKEGLTVKELVEKAEGLKNDAYLENAYIKRLNDDFSHTKLSINLIKELDGTNKTVLNEFDELIIYSKKDFLDLFKVEIKGLVRSPKIVDYSNEMTLGDLIFMAGGIKKQASSSRVEISRKFSLDGKDESKRVVVESFEIEKDLLSEKNQSIKLLPGDIVYIRQLSNYEENHFVIIQGEIQFPGTYAIAGKDEKITDLIERAGGLTNWAFLEGAYIERNNKVGGKGLTVIDLKRLYDKNDDKFDYVIREGDKLVIPRLEDFITLSGEVRYPKVEEYGEINIPVHNNRRAGFYVKKYAGGFDKTAKRSRTYVETPGGYVKRTINFGLFKIYPKVKVGEHIYVVAKESKRKQKREKGEPINWNRVIENTTTKLTGIATLWVLFQRVNL